MENTEIDAQIEQIRIRFRKLRMAVQPGGLAPETIENFRKKIENLETLRQ
ncbi:hypothetical protein ACFLZZ_01820 [Nanoarchaeota archaeon]